jgi:hypothetical protein
MESIRVKAKSGSHEIEIEGDRESVSGELAVWREWVAGLASVIIPTASSPPNTAPAGAASVEPSSGSTATAASPGANGDVPRAELDKVFRHDGRLVYLTALPQGDRRQVDGAMLILYGQRIYNNAELVTGAQIIDALERSGLGKPTRADATLQDYIEKQFVTRSGVRRGTKYRLTPPGLGRAKEIVRELLKLVG